MQVTLLVVIIPWNLCNCHRFVGKNDSITISVWNQRKVHKRLGAGFLGCVRITAQAIERLKDQGCEIALARLVSFCAISNLFFSSFAPATGASGL